MTDQKNDDLPDECKKAFEHWLSKKSLSAATDEDAWGQEIYKYPKIEAMWYAWKGVWNTRAQPVADDAGGDELDVHDRLRHMTDDFKMSQHQCRHQSEQISALQVELAQAKAALRQPAAAGAQATPGNRGVDVERFSPYATDYFGAPSVEWEKDENGDWVKYEDLITKGLLRTTPEDAKGDVCPTCNGDGCTVEVQPACCGRGSESGECCGIPVSEQVQEQCGHCYGSGVIAPQPEHEGEK